MTIVVIYILPVVVVVVVVVIVVVWPSEFCLPSATIVTATEIIVTVMHWGGNDLFVDIRVGKLRDSLSTDNGLSGYIRNSSLIIQY